MNNLLYSLIALFFIIILITILCFVIYKFSPINNIDSEMHEYNVLLKNNNVSLKNNNVSLPLTGNGNNMNWCPSGCVRGTCTKGKECVYDFQCQYCEDKKTKMFYVNFDQERNILPLLEEQKRLSEPQKDDLNMTIQDNNNYIKKLNIEIRKMNS
jgi:hypothetical protein